MNQLKGVSVIVCCYNSAARITPTLEHLQKVKQDSIKWEVIVVDNNSSDETAAIARKVWDQNPVTELRIVSEKQPGLMHARIRGVSVSTYDILSFIDDDNWVDENWIQCVDKIFHSDPAIAACGGDSIPVFESNPPEWFTRFENSFAVGRQQESTGYVDDKKGYLWGAGLSIRKSAWLGLFANGFTSRLSGRKGTSLTAGEDSEICLALIRRGWKLWYDSSLKLRHFIPTVRLSKEYLKKMYNGFGKAEMTLSIYRLSVTNSLSKASWVKQLLSAFRLFLRSGFKSIFSTGTNHFINQVMWSHDKAYVSEILANRSAYNNIVRSVQSEKITQRSEKYEMIISHHKKFIYIHIYKVAGMSIRAALQPYDDLSKKDFPYYENLKFDLAKRFKFLSGWSIDHIKAKKVKKHLPPETYDSYFKFTFVRNPWDWQVSLYHFMLQYPNHPQHSLVRKMKSFDEYIQWRVNEDLELQKDFIYDEQGNKIVDFVGRFEHLQEDFNKICSRLSLNPVQLPYINKSKHKPYKEYYNETTIKLVGSAFKTDIEIFNYDF